MLFSVKKRKKKVLRRRSPPPPLDAAYADAGWKVAKATETRRRHGCGHVRSLPPARPLWFSVSSPSLAASTPQTPQAMTTP
jgi:hypothetical protein